LAEEVKEDLDINYWKVEQEKSNTSIDLELC
jgi:hypothetical protein